MDDLTYKSYLDESLLPYFFCPGCGHGVISDHLNKALVNLQLDPHKVVIVTDIGCSGLTDKYFTTNTFHGLHGRSITYATGIKLANPDLKVIVLMGDGGCGIGGHHLINAARRNIGITVIVFNNFNYGMTGGEHSVTTPVGGLTSSTPMGSLEQPMDICQTVAVNGATYVARTTVFDKKIPDTIAEAIQHDGFSLIDIWELCTAYYVPNNRFNKTVLEETLQLLNMPTGLLHRAERSEYRRAYAASVAAELGKPTMPVRSIMSKYTSTLEQRFECVIAGAAGRKINSAASLFCRGAVLSGLYATQRNDYPVTVKSGHSISEVILSPQKISYTGMTKPNMMVVLFPEGLSLVKPQLVLMTPSDALVIHQGLLPVQTKARVLPLDFTRLESSGIRKESWAVMALAAILERFDIYPLDALREAVGIRSEFAEANLAAVEAGRALLV